MIQTCLRKKVHLRAELLKHLENNPEIEFDEEAHRLFIEKEDLKEVQFCTCNKCKKDFELSRVYKKYIKDPNSYVCKYCRSSITY